MNTTTKNMMIRVPAHIANRLESVIPPRKRNQFIVDRLSEAIEEHDAKLAHIATLVTAEEQRDPELRALANDWETVVADGLGRDNADTHDKP